MRSEILILSKTLIKPQLCYHTSTLTPSKTFWTTMPHFNGKGVSIHPENDYMNQSILEAKRCKRKLERTWRHDMSSLNRSWHRKAVNRYNWLLNCAQSRYYTETVEHNKDNPTNNSGAQSEGYLTSLPQLFFLITPMLLLHLFCFQTVLKLAGRVPVSICASNELIVKINKLSINVTNIKLKQ